MHFAEYLLSNTLRAHSTANVIGTTGEPEMAEKTSVSAFLPLKPRVFMILLVLRACSAHGYKILQEMERRSGGTMRMDAGLLYRTIARLAAQDLIQRAAPPAGADPRRKYYAITRLGKEVVAAEAHRQTALLAAAAVESETAS